MERRRKENSPDSEDRFSALLSNVSAIQAVVSAVEGTIGPKGLDAMLVDDLGNVVVTNDGVTILEMMDAPHPAAKILINMAKGQDKQIGDGTTTAALIASSIISEGVNWILKGVPPSKIIEGIEICLPHVLAMLKGKAIDISSLEDPKIKQVALTSSKGKDDIACLIIEGAKLVGRELLLRKDFKFQDTLLCSEQEENEVFPGVILQRNPVFEFSTFSSTKGKILVIDDALEPEKVDEGALATEKGFAQLIERQESFVKNINKLKAVGVKAVFVDRGIDDAALELLNDAGILAVARVGRDDWKKICSFTGAIPIKIGGLNREPSYIEKHLGDAEEITYHHELREVRILGGKCKSHVTILIAGATEEVIEERLRIAKDTAAAVQSAVQGGVIPGEGIAELHLARSLERMRSQIKGISTYGLDCLVAGLRKPFLQIMANAGFSPLEKLEQVLSPMDDWEKLKGIDCETGEVIELLLAGIVDPVPVKIYAIKSACEIAVAILRINTIIKMRTEFDH